ncbi:MAG: hypothetical protein ACR2NZ_00325 [Rubripirellula sp.]
MPIRIKCKCGKTLNIPDGMAGKAVKCPGCSQVLRVPGGSAGAAAAPKPAAAPPAPAPAPESPFGDGGMSDLFDEEGFSSTVEALCPVCRAEMSAAAILCTKCGYHKESGTQFESHKTAGVDIDHGTLALDKAAEDMEKAQAMQAKLVKGGGMPWWGLALTLFMLGSGLTIAVLAVNASRRVDESFNFNPLALFFLLSGCAFYAVSQGAFILIVVHAFKQTAIQGLLTLFVPFYALYHVAKNWSETWRYFAAAVVLGLIGGALMAAAASQGGI